MSGAGQAVRETAASLRTVAANPGLRRVNLALAGSLIGDWAYATAVIVWAYQFGGATAVGVWAVVRLSLLALVTPFAGSLADRYPRTRVMITSDLVRAVLVTAAAAAVLWDLPALVVFVLATLASVTGSPFRPAQMSLMPSLAERPDELTAANGVASTLESLAFFVGPAIGGLLITVIDVPAVFLLNALTFLWSAALVSGIRVPVRAVATGASAARSVGDAPDPDPAGAEASVTATATATANAPAADERAGSQAVAGFRTIWAEPDLRLVSALYCAQTVVAGASAVFLVSISADWLHLGPQGVGYLDSIFGIGALLGGLVAVARATRHRLATDFGIGVALWALPLLLIVAWPTFALTFAALVVMGGANPVVDVNASTIVQRLAPERVMGRVFGALESALIGTMALGSLVMPLLIAVVGLRWGLAVIGVGVGVLTLPAFGRLRRLDLSLREPEGLALVRATAIFAPLAPDVLEALARQTLVVQAPAGLAIVSEGEVGDRFYIIESGQVQVTQGDRVLRVEGPGDVFGEIALLRDVPRTATVTALEDTVLRALEREHFLAAVTGNADAQTAAEDIVARRLPT
jgi:MFS family permease